MNEPQASGKADAVLLAILTNQPSLFGSSSMLNENDAQQMARTIAAFRQELITKLLPQQM